MKCDSDKPHRRPLRLKGYDYRQAGAYFITICTKTRACWFGDMVDGKIRPNPSGDIVSTCWHDLPNHYPHAQLDAFVIMPNHVHGIILLADHDATTGAGPVEMGRRGGSQTRPPHRQPQQPPLTPTPHGLPEIVRAFKSFSARRINKRRCTPNTPVWQRDYYEHIIRNEESLNRIREYIANNPAQWGLDCENPTRPNNVSPSPRDEPWRI